MKTSLKLAALAAGWLVAFTLAAFAATPDTAAAGIPYGAYIASALAFWTFAITGLAVWAAKKYLPPAWGWLITPDMVSNAVHYALAAIETEIAGKTVSPANLNAVVNTAVAWLVANEPVFAKWAGATLKPRVIAWMSEAGMISHDAKASDFARAPAGSIVASAPTKAS